MKKSSNTKRSSRGQIAIDKAMEQMDYILDVYEGRDFVEIIGKIGGDAITIRYYDNGNICER